MTRAFAARRRRVTVGYRELSAVSPAGWLLAGRAMTRGYGIIAVPTGIATVEMGPVRDRASVRTRTCHNCICEGHGLDATHCTFCGAALPPLEPF